MGLIPGKVEKIEDVEAKSVYISKVSIEIKEDVIDLNFLCNLKEDETLIRIIMSYYDLELGEEGKIENSYSASSNRFGVQVHKNKNKTLYEIEIYKELYPVYKNNYNMILYGESTANDFTSTNPKEIDFENNSKTYEKYLILNSNYQQNYDILNPFKLPEFENKTINAELVIMDISYNDYNYQIVTKMEKGVIDFQNNLYFDILKKEITLDNSYFKVNELALPIDTFLINYHFYGLGKTYSSLELEIEYRNSKKMLNSCKEAIFCFQ